MKAGDKSLERMIAAARDAGFKARATAEYNRILGWTKNDVNWDVPRILDFGCGTGIPAASFALRHPGATVVGADINPVSVGGLARTLKEQIEHDLPGNLTFALINGGILPDEGEFDLIYAWSVFEHVQAEVMVDIFRDLKSRLKTGGRFFLMTEPLYHSPNGSHLYRYHKTPWHHLLLSMDKLRESVITEKAQETELREWQQFMDLNRFTAEQIRDAAVEAGFSVLRQQIFRADQQPPERLTRIYQTDVLMASGLQLLLG